LYVNKLYLKCTETDLRELFGQVGTVEAISLTKEPFTK